MTNNKGKRTDNNSKKELVLAKPRKSYMPLAIAAVAIIIAATAFVVVYSLQLGSRQPAMESSIGNPIAQSGLAQQVSYPLSLFADNQAHYFEHKAENLTIRYFILKSSDGIVRAAFDACDVCWPAGKGYVQEGDEMVCRNCGRRFPSKMINQVQGGCNPAPLKREVQGDQLMIRVSDILQGQQYFNFRGRA
ncbi:MAG: DUF2318 domain-containing protein [Desulfobacteraceae bacterium]|nr:DUF2318 domain-containing protein [Desulfobacteraceae bacterium]